MVTTRKHKVMLCVLLTFLALEVLRPWRFHPATCWWMAERCRREYTAEVNSGHETLRGAYHVVSIYGYFVQRYPDDPKAAAGRAVLVAVMERMPAIGAIGVTLRSRARSARWRWVRHLPGIGSAVRSALGWLSGVMGQLFPKAVTPDWIREALRIRGEIIAFQGNNLAAKEVRKLLQERSWVSEAAMGALAAIAPVRFASPGQSADHLEQSDWDDSLTLYSFRSNKPVRLPYPFNGKGSENGPRPMLAAPEAWSNDARRVAIPTMSGFKVRANGEYGSGLGLHTVWIVDLEGGTLAAVLPTRPRTEEGVGLSWDGRWLKCGSEVFELSETGSVLLPRLDQGGKPQSAPEKCWREAERERSILEQRIPRGQGGMLPIRPGEALSLFEKYETLIRRFPRCHRSAAARVMIVGMMERMIGGYYEQLPRLRELHRQLESHFGEGWDNHMLRVRAGLSHFSGSRSARAEMVKLLSYDGVFEDVPRIASEGLACISSFHIKPARRIALREWEDGTQDLWVMNPGDVEETQLLPFPPYDSSFYAHGSLVWRDDLRKGAFVSVASYALWTVWVADLKAGALRSFFPSKPLPNPWYPWKGVPTLSPDGKTLKCRGETFIVDGK